jgi:UDP-N-acetylglucosamine 2-epimerase (non-hydrolysing)
MKLWFVLGTAAELIKIYPLIREAGARGIPWKIVSTGQSPVGLVKQAADFAISPADLIAPVKSSRDLESSAAALKWFTMAWRTKPAWYDGGLLVVHGDTLSTLVGAHWGEALSADVVHVEAGLRSPHLLSPFPEEINRRLVSKLAKFHMAPGPRAAENLREAGIEKGIVDTGGNTLADAIRMFAAPSEARGDFALVNIHRFENLRSPAKWKSILRTVEKAATGRPLIWVLHPQTKAKIKPKWRAKMEASGVTFTDRLPFSVFIKQLSEAAFLISDGGSNQEECSYLGVPCLLMRNESERDEGLGENNILSRFDDEVIGRFLENPRAHARPPRWPARSPSAVIMDALARGD